MPEASPAAMDMLLAEISEGLFLCEALHEGDIGSTLVVGEVGSDRSRTFRSNMEFLGLDKGELGTEDGAKSKGSRRASTT